MEQQELISLVEDLLGSNAGGGQALRPAMGADAPGAMTGLMAAATPIGIAIVDAATGRIMRVNTTFPRVMGIRQPPEAFGGVSLDRLGPTLAQPMVVNGLRQVIATGAPFSEIVPLAQTQPNPQPAYRRITISPVPRKGGSGQLLITVLDVTDQVLSRVRSEQAATDARDNAILHATGAPQAAPSRALEEQLRTLTEEKRSLEAMLARARDDARAELDRTQRELDHARRELEMHRGSTGGPDWQTGSGGALGTVIASSLTPGVALPTALDRVAQQLAEGLGDVCAIFFSGADGLLHVAAVHHCDPLVGSQLREFLEGRPPRPGEGAYGRVLDAGEGVVYEAVLPADLLDLFPGAGPQVSAAGVTSAVCVPLLGAMEPTGAVLLLSISRERGGTERRFSRQTQSLLSAASAPLSLALYTERLRRTVETAEAQHDALVAALPSGVAVYDSMGRLRSLNEAAERMLTAPGTKPVLLQGFLTTKGDPIAPEALPWMRVLRGERASATAEQIVASWDGGVTRPLTARPVPLLDAAGQVAYVAVVLQGEGSPVRPQPVTPPPPSRPPIPPRSAPPPPQSVAPVAPPPPASIPARPEPIPAPPRSMPALPPIPPMPTSPDLPPSPYAAGRLPQSAQPAGGAAPAYPMPPRSEGMANFTDACVSALRLVGQEQRRHYEVQMTGTAISVAVPGMSVEQLVIGLLQTAGMIFPPAQPLKFGLRVETAESLPGQPSYAIVRVAGARDQGRPEAAKPQLEALGARAASLGGAVRLHDDHTAELAVLLRMPIAEHSADAAR